MSNNQQGGAQRGPSEKETGRVRWRQTEIQSRRKIERKGRSMYKILYEVWDQKEKKMNPCDQVVSLMFPFMFLIKMVL